mgnify:CR=1 FL=1
MPNTREKLIESLICADDYEVSVCRGYPCKVCRYKGTDCTYKARADHLIANGVTVQEWISVKDRFPEKEGDYLIYATVPFNGRKFMAVMHYEKDAYLPIWSDTTHWMPLPQPPKGE